MSLTSQAIQHLEKSETLDRVNVELAGAKTKSSLLAVPSGFDLVNLEEYMPNRDNYRFRFATKSIPDFGEYCKEFDQEGGKCFINSDHMSAETFFDLGTSEAPLHQLHNARLTLDKTAAFRALLAINGERLSQKQASDFIEDWEENIVVFDKAGEVIANKMAAKRLREITIEQVREVESIVDDFSESMSAMERIEAKNQDIIPAAFEFKCDPYHGLATRAFNVRLSILTGGDKPQLTMRIVKLEAQEEDMAEEFKEILTDTFKDCELKTFIGEG